MRPRWSRWRSATWSTYVVALVRAYWVTGRPGRGRAARRAGDDRGPRPGRCCCGTTPTRNASRAWRRPGARAPMMLRPEPWVARLSRTTWWRPPASVPRPPGRTHLRPCLTVSAYADCSPMPDSSSAHCSLSADARPAADARLSADADCSLMPSTRAPARTALRGRHRTTAGAGPRPRPVRREWCGTRTACSCSR